MVDGKAIVVQLQSILNLMRGPLSPADRSLCESSAVIFMYDSDSRYNFGTVKSACNQILGRGGSRFPVTVRAPAGSTYTTTMPAIHRFRRKVAKWRKSPAASPRLPLQVQLAILRECLVSKTPIMDHRPHRQGISLQTLQVCRSWYHEGKKIFWSENMFAISNSVRVVAMLTKAAENPLHPTPVQGQQLAKEYGGEYCDFYKYAVNETEGCAVILAELIREHRAREVFRSVCQPDRPKPAMERRRTRAAKAGRLTLWFLYAFLQGCQMACRDFIMPDWYLNRNEHYVDEW
jgi:hypothetical protein